MKSSLERELELIHKALWGGGKPSPHLYQHYNEVHSLYPQLVLKGSHEMPDLRFGFLLSSLEYFLRFRRANNNSNNKVSLKFKVASYFYELDPQYSDRYLERSPRSQVGTFVLLAAAGILSAVKLALGAVVFVAYGRKMDVRDV